MKTFYSILIMVCLSCAVAFASDPNINTAKMSHGNGYSLALTSDGSVWSMGRNNHGELGYDTKGATKTWGRVPIYIRISPIKVTWIKIVSISTGYTQSAAIDDKGNVWNWGYRYTSYKGSVFMDRITPAKVIGLSNIVKVVFNEDGYTATNKAGTKWVIGNDGKVKEVIKIK